MRRTLAAAVAGAALVLSTNPTAAAAQPSATPGVAVIGDFGSRSSAERDVARMVAGLGVRTVVTTGDNLYDDASYAEAVGAYYCGFIGGAPTSAMCPASSMARVNAFFPATGNHDYSDGGIENYLAYFGALRGSTSYSVTRDGVEFIVVDSQAALDSPESMARQQREVRERSLRSTARWQVVVLHHPPYSSSSAHGSTPQFQWPYAQWGVDLVLSGHDHDYERLRVGGLTYVVVGTGGADLYAFSDPLPGSLVRDASQHGALVLRSTPTALVGEYWTTPGQRRDRFLVVSR